MPFFFPLPLIFIHHDEEKRLKQKSKSRINESWLTIPSDPISHPIPSIGQNKK